MSGDRAYRAFAIVFGLLSFSNFTKPFEMQEEVGLVFFGERLSGLPNLLIAPLFGLFLAAYAYSLWTKSRRRASARRDLRALRHRSTFGSSECARLISWRSTRSTASRTS